jgi:hypothetical protein
MYPTHDDSLATSANTRFRFPALDPVLVARAADLLYIKDASTELVR